MRIDVYLFEKGLCGSRSKAQRAIEEGRVTINGSCVSKPSVNVEENDVVELVPSDKTEFVGRGGNKLEYALETFGILAENKVCLDIGASTGGFTECLLINGAEKVYAVDSGHGQLAHKLQNDNRVVSIEGFNARGLTTSELDDRKMQLVVMDVSFISQKLLYGAILNVAESGADVITLIKPQFEAGRKNLTKKGVVKDEKIRRQVVSDIIDFAKSMNFEYVSHTDSPILGGDGNKEFLLHLRVK